MNSRLLFGRNLGVGRCRPLIFLPFLCSQLLIGADFSRDIRPILSGKCFKCHGPDAESRKADLRLDQRKGAIELDAIVPGSPEESILIERITTSDPNERRLRGRR